MNLRFENDVKMYGTQAYQKPLCTGVTFENDVKMYGTQALLLAERSPPQFENDVKMYGTQAVKSIIRLRESLRMM